MNGSSVRRLVGFITPLVLLIAGCGGGSSSSNSTFSISPTSSAIDTNGSVQFTASLNAGGAAAVNWSVSGGDASGGAGVIDATGLYSPPNYLTRDSVTVTVRATLQSNSSSQASATLTVTPGFIQPLAPEIAAMAAGGTLQVTGSTAEVTAGTVNWSLSTSSTGSPTVGSTYGTFGSNNCQHGSSFYTNCTVTYTAPTPLPAAGNTPVYIIGTVNSTTSKTSMKVLLNTTGINSSALSNQAVQSSAIQLGTSGGNNNDYDLSSGQISDCCGGTLGALVKDGSGTFYILSNNHVLAYSDQAAIGSTIVQPGLIDGSCTPYGTNGATTRPVGALTSYVSLSNISTNVDVAIAKIAAGSVDTSGNILQAGQPGSNGALAAAPPAAGTGEAINSGNVGKISLVKSGRTTGLTCSATESIGLNIQVSYFYDCAETHAYTTKTYTNQIGISGNSFSDAGDSGSLIMDASNAQPVGLLFAAGTDNTGTGITIANPASDVISALTNTLGLTTPTFVGGSTHSVSCINYDANTVVSSSTRVVTADQIAKAQTAANTSGAALVNPKIGILGVATGKSADNPGEATVVVYVNGAMQNVAVPATINGVRTTVIATDASSVANGTAPTTQSLTGGLHLPAGVIDSALAVKDSNWKQLMASDPAFFGVGVAQSHDNPNEAAILVFVDQKMTPKATPATIDGVRVRYMYMDRLHVTKSKYVNGAPLSNCALKSTLKSKDAAAGLDLNPPATLHLQ